MQKTITLSLVCIAVLTVSAAADPLPGQIQKFEQLPMINTLIEGTPYYGHDELSTAWKLPEETEYAGVFMADDFADPFDTPVLHITWWGSYMNNVPSEMVNQFMIVFENDVPVNAPGNEKGFSYPDPIGYQAQVVTRGMLAPGSGTFTETLIPGSNPDEPVYMYNAELACPFAQQPDTVYWLKIVALVDALPGNPEHLQWGWHNRDYTIQDPYASVPPNVVPGEYLDGTLPCGTEIWHFQDDAVTGTVTNIAILGPNPCDVHQDQNPDNYMECYYVDEVDGPDGIGTHSKDLAFVLYTPEPATISLMVIGAAAMLRRRKRS